MGNNVSERQRVMRDVDPQNIIYGPLDIPGPISSSRTCILKGHIDLSHWLGKVFFV
jgi:hypothetical protein